MTPSRIDVRVAEPADADRISGLLQACYERLLTGWYAPETAAAALPIMVRANPALLASGRFFVAFVDGNLAGCGGWSLQTPGTGVVQPGAGHIRHFATDPERLRCGIASAIMARCIADAIDAGLTQLDCYSTRPGEAFYAAAGFRRIGERSVLLAQTVPYPVIEMRRPLP